MADSTDTDTPAEDPFDQIVNAPFDAAISERYLIYAMSTITARSLPDLRDGLKPVHRRLLWAMRQLKLDPSSAAIRNARALSATSSVNITRMATSRFTTRWSGSRRHFRCVIRLVDGQGNFGNIDGDNAAAYRYTEARLTKTAIELMQGLDENATDFKPTYNGEDEEPEVMPGLFPNLLANGASGIAVGMATSIPSHNAAEVIDAAMLLIDEPRATHEQLMQIVQGPDFATGGVLVDSRETISTAYASGRGALRVRARFHAAASKDAADRDAGIERLPNGTWQLVISEIPYQVQKGKLIEQIAQLIADKKLPILDDVRDESDTEIRIVLVPKSRNVDPEDLKNALYPADRP